MNVKNITRLLASYYDSLPETPLTENEDDYAKQLKILINGGSLFETTNDLDFDSDEEDREIDLNSAYNLSDSIESSVSSDEGSSNSSQAGQQSNSSYIPSSSPTKKARKERKSTISLKNDRNYQFFNNNYRNMEV